MSTEKYKVWVCNECGAHEYNANCISEDDLEHLGCGSCGGWDFHLETKAEPKQTPTRRP